MENKIKVYDAKTKKVLEGTVVDTRHYKDLTQAEGTKYIKEKLADGTEVNFTCVVLDDVYSKEGKYKGKDIYYEKTFYYVNNIRYLYEEWYINDELVERRTTEYTEESYDFTKELEQIGKVGTNKGYYEMDGNYLTQGNPENKGTIDPFTGIYTIGEYNRVKNESITNIVKEKLSSYIVLHNRYLQMNNITYTFALPNIDSEDWERAISDISVFAFVQGIPMVGESYYNNYGIAGAQIVEREIYYGWPGERYELATTGIKPGDEDFPTYYSSYEFSGNSQYLLEGNGARIYYSAQAAAMEGYFPNIHSNDLMSELELDVSKLIVELEYRGNTTIDIINEKNNQTGQFGATGTTTYGPVILTYLINPQSESTIYLKQANYIYSEYVSTNYSKNRILNNGTLIGLQNYNGEQRTGTFEVNKNGTYVVAAREFGGTSGKSNKVTLNVIEDDFFYTDVNVQVGYGVRDPNTGRRYASVTLTGYGTPIFSEIDYVRTDGKAKNTLDKLTKPTSNAVYGTQPNGFISIYDSGEYRINTANGYGDKFDSDTINITIPNLPPIVSFTMNPTEKKIADTTATYDSVSGLTCTRYNETYLYKQGTQTLTVKATLGDEDVRRGFTTIADPIAKVEWTHYYRASSTAGWKNMGKLNVGSNNQYSTNLFNVGTHRVYVTATDIYGASTTSYIEFIVAEYIDTVNLSDWYVYDHYMNHNMYTSSGRINSPFNQCEDSGFGEAWHITTGTGWDGKNYVRFSGYPICGYTDWLIYPSDKPGTRLINFTFESNYINPHTLNNAGIVFNAGVVNGKLIGYKLAYYPTYSGTMYCAILYDTAGRQLARKDFSGWSSVMNMEVEMTQNRITIRQKTSTATNYTEVLSVNITPTGYYGFGPYASYNSHNCSQHSLITFSNIRMTRISN